MVKIGIIRCEGTMNACPGTGCFKSIREKSGQFKEYPDQDVEIIGVSDCGGCPGRDAARAASEMVRRGAEVIFLSTCMTKPVPTPPGCEHPDQIAQAIRDKTGVRVVMGTH
ncbi:MAG TPA: CGGC domain-containing protein [Methanotrichaceae archaeon]|nr:CGGC domain-containing protein [Methanotrichaceae archaeon]